MKQLLIIILTSREVLVSDMIALEQILKRLE